MSGHDIIVVGASVGGVEALTQLAKGLPADIPAAIFVVLHVPTTGTSAMPRILERAGNLKAFHPQDGDAIEPGKIYIAPPNYHLLLKRGYVRLVQGPRENGHRPAIDPLFRTAARAYGRRVVGVILSGTLDDGSAGLLVVKHSGGKAIVQSPDDALFAGMPQNAINRVEVDRILPLSEIPDALVQLAHEPVPDEPNGSVPRTVEFESDTVEIDMDASEKANGDRPGKPSGFGCPSCGGALWEMNEGQFLRFRCRIGHAWSEDSLLAEQNEAIEEALWVALKSLEERAALTMRMADRARDRQQNRMVARYEEDANELKQHAETIRRILLKDPVKEPPNGDLPDRKSTLG
ncbi:chemotaxis protein CheB [Microcoleus sp. FACHB-1515]|uniref:chemotaxis protein CheB n=1 Tax=Cyanophyceae TaxID=3028117 RepID=UPI0016844A79|nr:chemotaxis protein CheB [Microcoleus sp. FACHB-1515]MBD2089578.1 chemotaxis protein CheB [Microcoleus sp. FACHB-1515]